jgi:DNA (cytosine-5)-methyltransferase 1
MSSHLFPYKWYLKDGYPSSGIPKNNYNVFGTFICGGGSTMGYKLAGFNHLGGVEIDPPIADVYKTNHNPLYLYNQDIRDFNSRNDLPKELFCLDILDGSPPCSTFSMAGSREKAWGKEKVFREGQAKQSLDDLVFVYCDTIIKLQPKIFLLENVKGIIQGNAKVYSKKIVEKMTKAGYTVQVFCLNAASMGVPQKRERVFFIGHKKEFNLPKLKLEFSESEITYREIKTGIGRKASDLYYSRWGKRIESDNHFGDITKRINGTGSCFSDVFAKANKALPTITSQGGIFDFDEGHFLSDDSFMKGGSYPLDYNFKGIKVSYLIGMSVPPVMTAQIANQIRLQWLDKVTPQQPPQQALQDKKI